MNKTNLCDKLIEVNKLLEQHNIIDHDIDNIQKEIDSFKAKIVFVGGFSAGKTALINSILGGDEILKEDISPQTAIATEILYNTDEKIIRVTKDGTETVCTIDKAEKLSIKGFKKYIYKLNKDVLLQFPDKIIVDMPGFDSGIEAHNRAILQYISEAAAYIFVIDASKGTLSKSSVDFLQEIQEYSQTVKFVLTKCDKMRPEDITAIVENLQEIISSIFYEIPDIICTSNRDIDAGQKMISLISNLSTDELLLQKLGNKIIILIKQNIEKLITQLESIDFNPHELEVAIRNCERSKQSFINALNQKKTEINNDLHNKKTELIIQDVETELHSQIMSLISSAERGIESFNETINSILRKALMKSSQHHVEEMYDDLLLYLDEITKNNMPINAEDISNMMQKTVSSLKTIMETGKTFAKLQKYGKIYKIFSTGLAVTTSIVSPWMELIIIFLPDILSVFRNIFGESKEDRLRREIEHNVIPEICARLRPEINKSMNELEEQMIDELNEQYQKLIENKTIELEKLQAEKNNRIAETEKQKETLRESIQGLNKIVKEISINIKEC